MTVNASRARLDPEHLLQQQLVRLKIARWHWLENFDRTLRHWLERQPASYKKPTCTSCENRASSDVMATAIDRTDWQVSTGSAQTVILVDTRGYHKGLKPVSGHRVLL